MGQATNDDLHDTSPLVVGANTGIGPTDPLEDPRPQTPVPGTENYFRGIVDDLEMFVMGLNHTNDFHEYEFQYDNSYAAAFKPSNPVDLTGEGSVTFDDAALFASNWLYENTLEWTDSMGDDQSLIVGDLVSRSKGDFNFDGRVDLSDWAMLNSANPGVGASALTLIQGGAIPEPATAALAALAAAALVFHRRKQRPMPSDSSVAALVAAGVQSLHQT
jgi:trimeric autotransporter adhesin